MKMNVAIIGGGIEGTAAARYWGGLGASVTIHDRSSDIIVPPGVQTVLGADYLKSLNEYDLIVRSPGISPSLLKTTKPVTTGTKEFFQKCPARIIGVTGTKGKGTTSTLIARILEEAGKRVWLGGNIGRSPLDFLSKVRASDIVVLELSSFQLMELDVSPHIAVCLMVVPEHMDWHKDIREYLAAKGNIFWHQRPTDIAIFNTNNDFSTQIALLSPGRKIPYMSPPGAYIKDGKVILGGDDICATCETGLIGRHNLENICAAVTAVQEVGGVEIAAMKRAVAGFKGLEHRLEFVAEIDDVRYYDDSFSTTPETAIAAVASFEEPKVLILGGSDKKSDYHDLAKAVARGNVSEVILIGAMADKIKAALAEAGYTKVRAGGETMKAILEVVRDVAQSGDVVLLSPACASFGMFRDYKDRGVQFKSAVLARG